MSAIWQKEGGQQLRDVILDFSKQRVERGARTNPDQSSIFDFV